MALHKPFDRHFFTIEGAVKTDGGSVHLKKGEIGFFNMDSVTKTGAQAVSDFADIKDDTKLEIKMGKGKAPVSRTSSDKSFSTFPFTLKDVQGIKVRKPIDHTQVDELIVGYNGIDNKTAFNFEVGGQYKLTVRLSGESIGILGYDKAMVDIPVYFDVPYRSPYDPLCVDCEEGEVHCPSVVEKAVEQFKNFPLKGGIKVSEFVDVTPIIGCTGDREVGEIPFTFFTLTLCDAGDQKALAKVERQFPTLDIERVNRDESESTYQVLIQGEAVADLPESFVGEEDEEVVWVAGETCMASTKDFIIDVPEAVTLEELEAYYPGLEIAEFKNDAAEPVQLEGGCQKRFQITVPTNMVCEECDPIFKDTFRGEAPRPFGDRRWKEVISKELLEGCRCGIRIKGKVMELHPDNHLLNEVGFITTSTRVEADGGYISEVRYGYTQVDEPFNIEYLSRAVDSGNLGYNLKDWEDRSYRFFTGVNKGDTLIEKALKGEETHINYKARYLDYVVRIKRSPYFSQSFSGQENETINYHIMVEEGRETEVQTILESLAGAANLTVKEEEY